ncbi:MAG: phage baseplate assembly protein [Planctomycetota bacterium]
MNGAISRLLRPLRDRITALVCTCRVEDLDQSSPVGRAALQGIYQERLSRVPVWWPFGFRAQPPAGEAALVVSLGGARSGAQVICISDGSGGASDLGDGDVELYAPGSGARVRVHADGSVSIKAPAGVSIDGDLAVSGQVEDGTGSMAEMRQTYNAHVHPDPDGPTGPPQPLMGGL